jgi:hypothetical protein
MESGTRGFLRCRGENFVHIVGKVFGGLERIIEDGPWLYQGLAWTFEPFDGASMVPEILSATVQACVQIHPIPPMGRTKDIITLLANRFGEVVTVELAVVPSATRDFHG